MAHNQRTHMHTIGHYVAEWQMKKQYFIQRKAWAREIADKQGLTQPGSHTTAKFKERTYTITRGPRGGLQMRGDLPWQTDWKWFAAQREAGISWKWPEYWFA